MSEGRGLLPEWRYWPGILLAALSVVAVLGFIQHPNKPTKDQPSQSAQTYIDSRTPDERLADYTLWLERFTGLLIAVTAIQILFLTRADMGARRALIDARNASERQFNQTQQSLTTAGIAAQAALEQARAAGQAADAAVAAQCPWIKIQILSAKIKFSDRETVVDLSCQARNIGNSPAKSVKVLPAVFAETIGAGAFVYPEKSKELRTTIENWRAVAGGHALFPNDQFTETWTVEVSKSDVESALAKAPADFAGKLLMSAVVYVIYNFVGGDGESNIAGIIWGIDEKTGQLTQIDSRQGTIPAHRLKFEALPVDVVK